MIRKVFLMGYGIIDREGTHLIPYSQVNVVELHCGSYRCYVEERMCGIKKEKLLVLLKSVCVLSELSVI